MASVAEVADGIFRINMEVPGAPITYSLFVIRDDEVALVETGYNRLFDETAAAVRSLVDPSRIRHIIVPHFEGDECGALNSYLDMAPNAVPVCSPIGALTNISDFAIREPMPVEEGQILDLGSHRLGFLITPYVHTWDGLLAYDQTTRTVFCSDVFIQHGVGPPTTDRPNIEESIERYRRSGIFPSRAHLGSAIDKIEALEPRVLACHHGSVITGGVQEYIDALRDADVSGVAAWDPAEYRR